eukprot:gb/GECG01006430.1/.p1 GENE.gb/GECG01006430.1/~~gb/GECG01006430.1/.p1  ORF type:complete len:290 (+),score=34.21 gb/GECG01006430.1/:1-870(+)
MSRSWERRRMSEEEPKQLKWLAKITDARCDGHESHFILIVLNSSLSIDQLEHSTGPSGTLSELEQSIPMLLWLWKHSTYRIAADGAANSLRFYSEHFDGVELTPDVICGDMDSVTQETLEYFKAKQVPVVIDGDQDKNDLFKGLDNAQEHQSKHGNSDVFVYGAFGGRLDQQMQSLNSLYIWRSSFSSLCLVSEESLAALISAGQHQLHVATQLEGPICGIIPIGIQEACVSTSGLKWNLHKSRTGFGGLISSSNEILPETKGEVTISSDFPLLWTTEVHGGKLQESLR